MIVFFIVLVIGVLVAQSLTLRWTLRDVRYETYPSSSVVDPGERFDIVSRVLNAKRLPEMHLTLKESMPAGITLYGEYRRTGDGGASVESTFFLLGRQQYSRRVEASFDRRGRYFLRGAALSGGDFLGLHETTERYSVSNEIVVLPVSRRTPALERIVGGFLGDMSVRRFILPDPVLTLGVREYTGREPQKDISWAHSARAGKLLVKNFDHTLELTVTVLLNVEYPDAPDAEVHAQTVERCFSLARGVCEMLEEKGIQYGFLTNATAAGAIGHWSSIGAGLGGRHLLSILEGLGRATYQSTEPFERTLLRATQAAEHGRSHIVITPARTDAHTRPLARLRDMTGGGVYVIEAGETGAAPSAEQTDPADASE